jgi:hypothetical protein
MKMTPQEGDKIEVQLPFAIDNDPWYTATVCCILATQFTAAVTGKGKHFFFFNHYGDTWKYPEGE